MSQAKPLSHLENPTEPDPSDLLKLAGLIRAYAPYDGVFALRLPGVYVSRHSRPYKAPLLALSTPALCIVAQGAKAALLGSERYEYNPAQMIVFSVDLPLSFQVTRASPAEPFLCLRLDLDPRQIAELILKVYPHGLPAVYGNKGVYIGGSDAGVVKAALRLLELMASPQDAELLAPLAVEEVLIRLLRSSIGSRVAQIGLAESSVYRIARAIRWIRSNFDQPMRVEALARMVNMSPSSFYQHFKAVTSMSPLQFQKILRLQEARRLMLTSRMDAATAARQVGYASPSQFSREYRRLFGSAPSRDINRLREQGELLSAEA
ncbi:MULTISPECIES: AraC family transcriptional regulator [unclassified Meiothermus]|uniref:AraC family transcriptional regulator n=1 Tax=unclassified Meiothermus TaxID=370471 RepID=UPI000D7D1C69|nr:MULTISPECIES: AraC family transcriptional regulator [unclassified Meiothermus]PZA06779.1 AraC family transcriptional regulator [Meiothermus sp. Pnk-1]RYM33663.1 AraC family transcriptional regulator [Meiothermus sp. PNK-Is4]